MAVCVDVVMCVDVEVCMCSGDVLACAARTYLWRLSVCPCSLQFATCGSDCTVRIWDASNYGVVLKSNVKGAGTPNCIGRSGWWWW